MADDIVKHILTEDALSLARIPPPIRLFLELKTAAQKYRANLLLLNNTIYHLNAVLFYLLVSTEKGYVASQQQGWGILYAGLKKEI